MAETKKALRAWARRQARMLADEIRALRAERDELRQRILDSCPSPDEGGRIHAGGRIVCGQCHDSEVRHLTNERDEARARAEKLAAYLDLANSTAKRQKAERDEARAVLAKYEEGA